MRKKRGTENFAANENIEDLQTFPHSLIITTLSSSTTVSPRINPHELYYIMKPLIDSSYFRHNIMSDFRICHSLEARLFKILLETWNTSFNRDSNLY